MSKVKTERPDTGFEAVEAYLAEVAEPARSTLLKVRERIRKAAPADVTEEMGYGVPSFRLPKATDYRLAGYAAGKKFCSYYPMSGWVVGELAEELKEYKTSSGAIQFPLDKPLSASLVKLLVNMRLADMDRRAAKKKK